MKVVNRYEQIYRQASMRFLSSSNELARMAALNIMLKANSLMCEIAVLPEVIGRLRALEEKAKRGVFVARAIIHTRMKANYFRVSRLVVLPDYQGIGIGKRLLNFIAELYTSQVNLPFYLVTSNPQLIRGNLDRWKIKRVGHGSQGREDTRINQELSETNCRRRLSVSLEYIHEKRNYAGVPCE